jgi:hypothetical protein
VQVQSFLNISKQSKVFKLYMPYLRYTFRRTKRGLRWCTCQQMDLFFYLTISAAPLGPWGTIGRDGI